MKFISVYIMICLLPLVSAFYAGDTINQTFNGEILNCSIIGNTYDLEGLNLTWEGSTAFITTKINYKPDKFKLECLINETTETERTGGHIHYIKPNLTNFTIPLPEVKVNDTKMIVNDTKIKEIPKHFPYLYLAILIVLAIFWIIFEKRKMRLK